MCVIVYKPAGTALPADVVKRSWDANPHGFGLAWWAPGKPATRRKAAVPGLWYHCHGMTLRKLEVSVEQYITPEQPAVLHCRIASRGGVSLTNTHPFEMPRHGALLVHNGTLGVTPTCKGGTDSQALALWLDAIENLPELLGDEGWVERLGDLIDYSKLAIMDAPNGKPRVTLVNSSLGVYHGELWASNDGAFVDPKPIVLGPRGKDAWKHAWSSHGYEVWEDERDSQVPKVTTLSEIAQRTALPESASTDGALTASEVDALVRNHEREALVEVLDDARLAHDGGKSAAEVFEMALDFEDIETLVRSEPDLAADALWYYRGMLVS